MDLVNLIIGFILGTLSSIIGAFIYTRISQRAGNRNLRRILNFGKKDEIIFVFSHRHHVPDALLPRTSTEDFVAMNNVVGALMLTGWKGPVRVRDTKHINDIDKS